VLDADISLSPAGEGLTRAALTGSYRHPLVRIGAALDKAILNKVAVATISALLRDVADAVTSPATAGHCAEDTGPWWPPVPQPEMP
jgi:hypothetical protein